MIVRLILVLLWTPFLFSQKICLNMIVKDEKPVIERCLNSVKGVIDYWVIVDTGSTDGTQEIIRECMKGIPGELHERPWVNFGHNRNEALRLAKGKADYIFLMDADEVWMPLSEEKIPESLSLDAYFVKLKRKPESHRIFFIKDDINWYWQGVVHEQLKCSPIINVGTLDQYLVRSESSEGNRSKDPDKWIKDAQVLEKGLLDEPGNAEYVFYLAQSYANAGKHEKALENYLKRADMGGPDEYVFWSLYVAARIQEILNYPEDKIIATFNRAYAFRPIRAEPIFAMAARAFNQKNYVTSYALSQMGLQIAKPSDLFYVQNQVYDYEMLILFADSALNLGKKGEAYEAMQKLDKISDLPEHFQQNVKKLLVELQSKNPF